VDENFKTMRDFCYELVDHLFVIPNQKEEEKVEKKSTPKFTSIEGIHEIHETLSRRIKDKIEELSSLSFAVATTVEAKAALWKKYLRRIPAELDSKNLFSELRNTHVEL
jgi:hypothetical protein